MTGWEISAAATVALVAVVTFYLGRRSATLHNAAQDFDMARRTVRSRRNAAAVSGEYLCAASFLGIAGAILTDGADALWYPIGFTAGYLVLMLFVAAPLRRSGAYTLPDFVEARLDSRGIRWFASLITVLIALLYMVPQLQGAQLAVTTLFPVPDWAGPVAVIGVVLVTVLGGGMRATTLAQAFHYWLKLFAIAVPTLVLCVVFIGSGGKGAAAGLADAAPPTLPQDTTVTVDTPVKLQVSTPTTLYADGVVDGAPAKGEVLWSAEVRHDVAAGTTLRFDAGTPTPVVVGAPADNADWLAPGGGDTWDLLGTYSLLTALMLGTMGLPHILARFYTNPDGRAARRTTLHVVLLIGLFYLFPVLLGALSRLYVPRLLVTGEKDAAVLLLPTSVLPGIGGQILAAVIVAGVFSAFLAATSGLVYSVAGVISADLMPERVRDFRSAAVLLALSALGIALVPRQPDIAHGIAIAFALAASTFCPVLVLGIWWRGLTAKGAAAGMFVGGVAVLTALGLDIASDYTGGWAPVLLERPALLSVPAAFITAALVSLASRNTGSATVNNFMLRMHAPDRLGFVTDAAIPRYGRAEERIRLGHGQGRHRR
ncbi:cation acetate symporter [Haloechinothrix salitolerans]|uniref:Cation acetate symporter n=1 Tax=Haloechinothrix salitolerans TaxID=926830 RepID=A0ABW2BRE1_9PSEU